MLILYIFACLLSAATTLTFTLLKLYHVVQWSWLLVLSPIWILWILFIVVIGATCIVLAIQDRKEKARRSGLDIQSSGYNR